MAACVGEMCKRRDRRGGELAGVKEDIRRRRQRRGMDEEDRGGKEERGREERKWERGRE